MNHPFVYRRRVEFRDTDMAGIVHFSVFFTYMEEAEHEFLRSLGLSVVSVFEGQKLSWPRVAAKCNYRRAIRFEELIDLELTIGRIGEKSVTYHFKFKNGNELVADGEVTTVCCQFEHGSSPQSIAIPSGVRDLLNPFVVSQM